MSILDEVPSEAKCRQMIRKCTFGPRTYCPHCMGSRVRAMGGRFWCPRCRRKFSLTSCSWLRGMRISYRTLWLLVLCWQRRMPFGDAVALSGLSAPAARRWFRLFRENLAGSTPELGGIVEVDESFFGRRRNGSQRIVLGAVERGTWRVALRVVPNRGYEQTDDFILEHVLGGSTVCTDGAKCYEGIRGFWGYDHVVCNHSKFVFGPTNRVESVWSALKRFLKRTLGRPNSKFLPELVREFEIRVNDPQMFDSPLTFLETSLNPVPSTCY